MKTFPLSALEGYNAKYNLPDGLGSIIRLRGTAEGTEKTGTDSYFIAVFADLPVIYIGQQLNYESVINWTPIYTSNNMSSSESVIYTGKIIDGKKIYRSTISITVSAKEWKFEQVVGNSLINTSGAWIDGEHSFFIGTNYTKPVVYYENNGYSNWVRVKNGTNKVDVYSEESGTFFISLLFTLD